MQSSLVPLPDCHHHGPHKANSSTSAACQPSSALPESQLQPHPNPKVANPIHSDTLVTSSMPENHSMYLGPRKIQLFTKLPSAQLSSCLSRRLITGYLGEAKLSTPLLPSQTPVSQVHRPRGRRRGERRIAMRLGDQTHGGPPRIPNASPLHPPRYGQPLGRLH